MDQSSNLYVSKKISKVIGILCKLRHFSPQHILLMLYNTLIQPHLLYCNSIWAADYPSNLDKLNKLIKRAARIITFSQYCAPSQPLLKKLKILNLKDLHTIQIASFIFKFFNTKIPATMSKLLIKHTTQLQFTY